MGKCHMLSFDLVNDYVFQQQSQKRDICQVVLSLFMTLQTAKLRYQNLQLMQYQYDAQRQTIHFLYVLFLLCNLQIWYILTFLFIGIIFSEKITWTKVYHHAPGKFVVAVYTLSCHLCT